MTNKLQQITTLALATILIAGSFSLTPFAYSTNNDNDDKDNKWKLSDKDNKWKLSDKDNKGKLSYDEHDDDEHDDDEHDDDEHDDEPPIVDPPTITIVNRVTSTPEFTITVSSDVGNPTAPGSTTTYTVDSYTQVTISGPLDRPILITGDGNCPENVGGFVNIENGQNITCYYDDRQIVQTGSGVIFHFDTLQFNIDDGTGNPGIGVCDGVLLPCINFHPTTSAFIIVPDIDTNDPGAQQLTDTTLVLVNVMDLTQRGGFAGCTVNGIDDELTTGKKGFIIKCPDLSGTIELDTFNANFALIETAN